MIASEGFLAGYAFAWFLAISLLNFMTATFYILSQGDEFLFWLQLWHWICISAY
jgi:hypothetical protein